MRDRRALIFGAVPLALGIAIAAASIRGEPQRKLKYTVEAEDSRRVTPRELADWIVKGRRDFAVVDMRDPADYEKGHVRAAVNCGSCHENREAGVRAQHGEGFVDLSKKLVLYTGTDAEPIVLPRLLHDNPNLYRLAGGWEAWKNEVLTSASLEGIADEAELDTARRHEAVRALVSGERSSAGSVAKLPVTPIKRVGEHKVATGNEGC
jgi:rhodanese-related sulfurtransferase